jgi:hypothetical protein
MPVVETLHSPFRSRERIMAFGHEGSGKSSGILSIARRSPDAKFWVIDNDNAYDRLLETEFTDVWNMENVLFAGEHFGKRPLNDWDNVVGAIKYATDNMDRDDWLVIDMVSKLWSVVQEAFIDKVFDRDIDDYFMHIRQLKAKAGDDKKALGAMDGWKDWPVINSMYSQRVADKLLNCPGHLYVVAESQKISDEDDKGIRDLYGPFGVKPAGQKRSGHIMQTVMFFTKNSRTQEYKMSTIKDRGRAMWTDDVFQDFAIDYLVNTAGWEVKKSFVKVGTDNAGDDGQADA